MCTLVESLTYPFRARFATPSWQNGLAEEHRWVPNSGWTTFHMRSKEDLSHALWLLRLSYLRYSLKTAADPLELLERQSEELRLSPQFKALVAPFVPKAANHFPAAPIKA